MSCGWCGHGYCHHCGHCHGYGYGYGYGPPPFWAGYGPGYGLGYGYGPRRRGRRALDEEDLAAYLEELEDEIGRVREELAGLRRRRPAEEGEGG